MQVHGCSRLDARRRLPDGEAHEPFPAVEGRILADIAARSDEREAFLAKLVQTPSSNPPGDCAPIAEVATELLEGLGFTGRAPHRVRRTWSAAPA